MFNGATAKERMARGISGLAQAPIVAIPTFILIDYFSLDFGRFLPITALCLLFSSVLPFLVIGFWIRRKGSEADIPRKEDRTVPLSIIIVLYLAGAVALCLARAPLLAIALMFCYFSNTLVVFLINLFWKISIHAMGVAGPATALAFAFGMPGALLALLLPPVMWSRVYLKRHTPGQVIAGALLGFILTAAQIYLAYRLNG